MDRQFRRRFRVRRAVVQVWLEFLAANHPGYRGFVLRHDNLSQLPVDDTVFDQLTIHEVVDGGDVPADSGPVNEVGAEDADSFDEVAIPNMLIHESELGQLRGHLAPGPAPVDDGQVPIRPEEPQAAHQLRMPSVRRTPLDEFNQS